jgi:hypothetical protein
MTIERDRALLAFSIGPVQSFIAAARRVRDLWTGSYLLAWLTHRAMQPVLTHYGTHVFVSPAGDTIEASRTQLKSPCLPGDALPSPRREKAFGLRLFEACCSGSRVASSTISGWRRCTSRTCSPNGWGGS